MDDSRQSMTIMMRDQPLLVRLGSRLLLGAKRSFRNDFRTLAGILGMTAQGRELICVRRFSNSEN